MCEVKGGIKMKIKCLIVLLAVFMVAAVVSKAEAFAGPAPKRPSIDKLADRMAKDLDLTDKQKSNFLDRAKKTKEEPEGLLAKNKGLMEKMQAELGKDNPNRDVIHNYVQEIGKNRTEMQFKRLDDLLEFRKQLTPEQQKKFKEMHAKRKEKAKKRIKDRKNKKPGRHPARKHF